MKKIEIYEHAINSIFDYTSGDVTSCIIKEYAIKGMYNLLTCLNGIGYNIEKTKLVALPDFTYSRNDKRYNSNFPYGSIINIDTEELFIPVEFRPNCCGITFLKLSQRHENLLEIQKRMKTIENLKIGLAKDDLNRGNHFIGVYRENETNSIYAIIHGSFNFVKEGDKETPGLYIDKTNYWNEKISTFKQDDFSLKYLIGSSAELYYEAYLQHEEKTKKARAQIGQYLFPNSEVIFNETHEGFFNKNTIMLGAYIKSIPFWAPIMLSAESDLSIVNITNPLSCISQNMYVCPHGGGYKLQHVKSGKYDLKDKIYTLEFSNHAIMKTDDVRKLIYDYRTNTDDIWTKTHDFGNIKNKFTTLYNLKL